MKASRSFQRGCLLWLAKVSVSSLHRSLNEVVAGSKRACFSLLFSVRRAQASDLLLLGACAAKEKTRPLPQEAYSLETGAREKGGAAGRTQGEGSALISRICSAAERETHTPVLDLLGSAHR